jgi:hypothetical protein
MSKLDNLGSNPLGRRSLLAWSVGLIAAPFVASARAFAGPKVSKASVGFLSEPRGEHRCGTCKLFRGPSACLDVEGAITENCSCKIWLPKQA